MCSVVTQYVSAQIIPFSSSSFSIFMLFLLLMSTLTGFDKFLTGNLQDTMQTTNMSVEKL